MSAELHYETTIEASPEVVFRHLTERDGLLRWMAVQAEADPTPGGVLRWTHENGATMAGRFVELDPPTRVVFRYGWEGGLLGLPPESSTVEITLTSVGDATTHLELVHRDLPPAAAADHEVGWRHFLGVLVGSLDGESVNRT